MRARAGILLTFSSGFAHRAACKFLILWDLPHFLTVSIGGSDRTRATSCGRAALRALAIPRLCGAATDSTPGGGLDTPVAESTRQKAQSADHSESSQGKSNPGVPALGGASTTKTNSDTIYLMTFTAVVS